ncbi:MAG: hypothetical protein ACI861_001978, partial [Paracoccaceae bacterium]
TLIGSIWTDFFCKSDNASFEFSKGACYQMGALYVLKPLIWPNIAKKPTK